MSDAPERGAGVLAIDVSNTHTAFALWDGEHARQHWSLATDAARTPDEHVVLLTRLFARDGIAPEEVGACVAACVVPEVASTIDAVCRMLFDLTPLTVAPGVASGLPIVAENSREIGPDRIANGVAAKARFGAPVLVLDFGTALTVDVISAAGAYVGAIIAPGVDVAADALARRAARLGRIELTAPPRAIADNTVHALQSGMIFGYAGLVEGLVARACEEVGPARVVATGEAPWMGEVLAHVRVVDAYEPLLTLDGLRRIHEWHRARAR